MLANSGGRTSAFLTKQFLDAHDGNLPDQVVCVFTNTGKEDERTLRFLERQSIEWDLPITWLEYRFEPFPDVLLLNDEFRKMRRANFANRKDKALRSELAAMILAAGFPEQAESIRMGRESLNGRSTYEIVNYATASRDSEPYNAMLEARENYRAYVKDLLGVIPNPSQRICTGELKMNTAARYAFDLWGTRPGDYHVALALRGDEREGRAEASLAQKLESGIPHLPLFDNGIVATDIAEFWRRQPFQLGLKSYEGNCRECYMKGPEALYHVLRQKPEGADWWIGWEDRTKDKFRRDRMKYRGLKWQAINQPVLFEEPDDLETVITCEGGYCAD